jgi:hypothetical protein
MNRRNMCNMKKIEGRRGGSTLRTYALTTSGKKTYVLTTAHIGQGGLWFGVKEVLFL